MFAEEPMSASKADAAQPIVLKKGKINSANLPDIDFPNEFGDIKELWTPFLEGQTQSANDKVILHIRDAHCHFEAQTNISKIIDNLMTKYEDLSLIAVEGSVGVIDTTPFSEFSDDQVKEEVAIYFMKKGKVTGPEFLSIMKKHPIVLYGIETRDYYNLNLKAFLDLLPFREESQQLCEVLQVATDHIKEFVFSPELVELTKHKKAFDAGQVGFFEHSVFLFEWYVKYVQSGAENIEALSKEFPNFAYLAQVTKLQPGINSDLLETERNKIISIMDPLLDSEQKNRLVTRSLQLRIGRLSPTQYYVYLESLLDLLKTKNKDLENWHETFAETKKFVEYSHLYEKINKTILFQEMDDIVHVIAYKIMKTDAEKEIYEHDRRLAILRKLYYLQFGHREFDIYMKDKKNYRSKMFVDVIYKYSIKYNLNYHKDLLEDDFKPFDFYAPIAEQFYKYAKLRDQVLLENTLSAMDKYGAKTAFMITGGFHTEGLIDKLRDAKIGYAIISPLITQEQSDDLYIDVLSNQKTPFEEFLTNVEQEET